jgi:hypothetical protein
MTALENEPSFDDDWQELLRDQRGVVHRADATPEYLRGVLRDVRRRRWQHASRDVFVNHNGPLTDDQQLWVVVKAAPPRSALSGRTAAALDGLRGFSSDVVHVTVPCGTSMPKIHGVNYNVHYSRFLDTADVHPLRTPRRTRVARSVLDAAAWASTDTGARAIILASVQQRLVLPQHLTEALHRRGPCFRHELIVETIGDAEGGIASVPEHTFNAIVAHFNVPAPTRQRTLQRPNGRFYLDADWKEYGLCAEIDGMPHIGILSWDADLDRMNEIASDHRTLLRFTSFAVRHRQPDVGNTLVRALMSRGWR